MKPFYQYVMLLDGMCGLCVKNAPFTRAHDRRGRIHVETLQSEFGQDTLRQFGLPLTDFKSFVWIEKGRAYRKSAAALRYLRALDGAWPLLYVLIAVPPLLRDPVYDFVSARRYRWFGRRETCAILR
jgi:predicted DCC family thiol-disulfide oxidoreductase YuxK